MKPLLPVDRPSRARATEPAEDSDVRAELWALRDEPEFVPVITYHDELVVEVLSHDGDALREQVVEHRRAAQARLDELAAAARRTRWIRASAWVLVVMWMALCAVLLFGSAVGVFLANGNSERLAALVVVVVWCGLSATAVVGVRRLARTAPALKRAAEMRDLATLQRQDRRQALRFAYRRAVAQVLGSRALAPFPSQAPELVETAGARVVETRTISTLRAFVAGHSTSAVGVAGPRGVGKTTLLNSVGSEESTTQVPVPVSSALDGSDLLRRVAHALDTAMSPAHDSPQPTTALLAPTRRAWVAAVVAGMGGTLIATDLLEPTILASMGPLGTAGAVLLLVAVLLLPPVTSLLAGTTAGRAAPTSGARAAARALARDITGETSVSETDSGTVALGSWVGLERSRERSRTVRELGYAALIDRVRDVLKLAGQEAQEDGRRLVVVIDELDKLPALDHVLAVVNTTKDLFRIPGVHFLVSVSNEALSSFTLRGLQPRDAFDSSFDTVVEMRRLTSEEALSVLEYRVTGFPRPLARVCHVWSGGLARDLIRAARECIEIASSSRSAPVWSDIARTFLHQDLDRRIGALRDQGWLVDDAPVAEGHARIESGARIPDIDATSFNTTSLGAALRLVHCCVTAMSVLDRQSEPGEHDREELDSLAVAVSQLTPRAFRGIAGVVRDQQAGESDGHPA